MMSYLTERYIIDNNGASKIDKQGKTMKRSSEFLLRGAVRLAQGGKEEEADYLLGLLAEDEKADRAPAPKPVVVVEPKVVTPTRPAADRVYRSLDVAHLIGVEKRTIERWRHDGKLVPAYVTPGGHSRYTQQQVDEIRATIDAGEGRQLSSTANSEKTGTDPRPTLTKVQIHDIHVRLDSVKLGDIVTPRDAHAWVDPRPARGKRLEQVYLLLARRRPDFMNPSGRFGGSARAKAEFRRQNLLTVAGNVRALTRGDDR
jgi:hypothetical protein